MDATCRTCKHFRLDQEDGSTGRCSGIEDHITIDLDTDNSADRGCAYVDDIWVPVTFYCKGYKRNV
jgi:hypothetical protein